MSWIESVQNKFIITTGDGKSWEPLWRDNCIKDIEYNTAQFNFPKIQGSKIDRGTPMARKFSMEILFQGDDHLDTGLAFEISASDPRPWNLSHPIYKNILVQPISLHFDYSGLNHTIITGSLLETLGSAGLNITIDPSDKIKADKEILDEKVAVSFNSEMELLQARELTPSDVASRDIALSSRQVTKLTGINKTLYDIGVKSVKTTEDAGNYLNVFNQANASIGQGISQSQTLMQDLQAVINFPGQMITTVKVRASVLQQQFDTLRFNIGGIAKQSDKINYESISGSLVSTIAVSSITNTDYSTKTEVLEQIANVKGMHDQFLTDLDSLQTANGGDEDSYLPDSDSLSALDELVNFTIQNLYIIALSSKQERIIILEADSNPIILAHRFYGLLADDSTIATFMANNNIFLNEILQINKGRKLVFYI